MKRRRCASNDHSVKDDDDLTLSMTPRVTLSPLKSVDNKAHRVKQHAPPCDTRHRQHVPPSSGRRKQHMPSCGRRRPRSRNTQLTSLFDSLSEFFSADSDRRRRTAYVNATVSLAQSSLNPRHNFTTSEPPHSKPTVKTKSRPQTKSASDTAAQWKTKTLADAAELKVKPASTVTKRKTKALVSAAQLKTKPTGSAAVSSRGGRRAKNIIVKHTEKSASEVMSLDATEMNDLMTVSDAESESRIFHTAQNIAQQVVYALVSIALTLVTINKCVMCLTAGPQLMMSAVYNSCVYVR